MHCKFNVESYLFSHGRIFGAQAFLNSYTFSVRSWDEKKLFNTNKPSIWHDFGWGTKSLEATILFSRKGELISGLLHKYRVKRNWYSQEI